MSANAREPHIGLVVEGPGDANAVPLLFRNYLQSRNEYREILGKPVSCNGRSRATISGGLEGFVAAAAARPGCVGVLVILDADGDPSCQLGPELLARARAVSRVPVEMILCERYFESWIYASVETLNLTEEAVEHSPARSGLGAIEELLQPTKYAKPVWQPRLTSRMDISLASSRRPDLSRALMKVDAMASIVADRISLGSDNEA